MRSGLFDHADTFCWLVDDEIEKECRVLEAPRTRLWECDLVLEICRNPVQINKGGASRDVAEIRARSPMTLKEFTRLPVGFVPVVPWSDMEDWISLVCENNIRAPIRNLDD
jgi:hypothetical protein